MNKHVKVYANPECPREFRKRPFLSAQHQAIAFLVWAEQREKEKKGKSQWKNCRDGSISKRKSMSKQEIHNRLLGSLTV